MAAYCLVYGVIHHVTCGLTACTPGSAPGPTLGNEYGKTLPFLLAAGHVSAVEPAEPGGLHHGEAAGAAAAGGRRLPRRARVRHVGARRHRSPRRLVPSKQGERREGRAPSREVGLMG